MTAEPTVAAGMVVTLEYVLKNDAGEILDQSEPGHPLDYLHGAENIVPGLERKMTGTTVGQALEVKVAPGDGYGERMGNGPVEVSRSAFPDDAEVEVGDQFVAAAPDGEMTPLWIVEVRDDAVMVDPNHPLAGMTLHFSVKVLAIREATEEEQAHGHPHGPGGHHH